MLSILLIVVPICMFCFYVGLVVGGASMDKQYKDQCKRCQGRPPTIQSESPAANSEGTDIV